MRADFIVADLDAAMSYDMFVRGQGSRPPLVDILENGNLTGIEVTTLWAILEGVAWNADHHILPELLADGEGDSWLHEFPSDLVQLLAKIDEQSVLDAAKEWSATEELMCSPSDLVPGLRELSRLACVAREAKSSLFLWGAV